MRRTSFVVLLLAVILHFRAQAQQPLEKPPTLDQLEARARADSNDPMAYFAWASALAKDGRYVVAEGVLRTAVQIDPQYAPALLLLARASRVTELMTVTDGRGITIMRVDPQAGEPALLRRRAFLIDPLVELEIPSREQIPTKWRGTLGPAFHQYGAQHWAEAAAGFQTVIDRTVRPNDSTKVPPVALWYRARCALKLNEVDTAISYLEWLHRLRMQDSASELNWNPFAGEELRYLIAYVYQQARRWDEAIARYQELLELNLGLDGAHTHLAEIYEAQGRLDDAVRERVRAIQSNPDANSLYFNLGVTLVAAGRYEEAIAALKKYVESYPRDARAYYLLGASHMNIGDNPSAQTALKHFLAVTPSRFTAQIEDANRRLAALGS